MGELLFRTYEKDYSPAAVGTDETVHIFALPKGARLAFVSVIPVVNSAAGATSTISLGDTASATAIMAAKTFTLALNPIAVPVDGAGTNFNQGTKLYTADDFVNAAYTANSATGAKPVLKVFITVAFESRAN